MRILLVLLALFTSTAYADKWVTNAQNSKQYTVPLGTTCDNVEVDKSTRASYHNVTVKPGVTVPFNCKLVKDPVPTPTPTPVPPPTGCAGQTPEGVLASKTANYCYNDPRPSTGTAFVYPVAGTSVEFVTPNGCGSNCDGSIAKPIAASQLISRCSAGKMFVFRQGTYNQRYGHNWGNRNFSLGPSCSGIKLVAMPGEAVTLQRPSQNEHNNIELTNDGSTNANDVTIAGFNLIGGGGCIGTGGFWTREESGGKNVRIIANKCRADYTGNTMTGLFVIEGDGAKVLGNELYNSGNPSAPINNNHAIYVQVGADDVEIAYNYFHDLGMGHVIQFHNDGTKRQNDNAFVHHNYLKGIHPQAMRGINFGDVGANSTGKVEDNVLENLGQNFSALAVYCGAIEFANNRLINIAGGNSGKVWTGTAGTPCNPAPVIRTLNNTFTGGTGPDYSGNVTPQ